MPALQVVEWAARGAGGEKEEEEKGHNASPAALLTSSLILREAFLLLWKEMHPAILSDCETAVIK